MIVWLAFMLLDLIVVVSVVDDIIEAIFSFDCLIIDALLLNPGDAEAGL